MTIPNHLIRPYRQKAKPNEELEEHARRNNVTLVTWNLFGSDMRIQHAERIYNPGASLPKHLGIYENRHSLIYPMDAPVDRADKSSINTKATFRGEPIENQLWYLEYGSIDHAVHACITGSSWREHMPREWRMVVEFED